MTVALFTRNHGAIAASQVARWREILPSLAMRWLVVDLGSTDDTYSSLSGARTDMLSVPGGRAAMMSTLDRAMRSCHGDIVVFVDAAGEPIENISPLIQRVQAGAPIAVPKVRRPAVAVVSRKAWARRGFADYFDLWGWAVEHGEPAEVEVAQPGLAEAEVGSLATVIDRRKRRWLAELVWHLRR
jgi:hypothetical protein